MIGEVIDEKYKITRLIGEGGMGAVFEGENLLISRRVAIKVLHATMALNEQTVERFQREARAAGKIGNDHILEVLDLGKLPNGDHYMVLEFLDGEPLSGRIKRLGRLTPAQLAPLMTQVLTGLGAAHAAGIIHRDLKPDNLFILKEKAGRKDYVKIIDFGISKFNPMSGDDAQKKMTQTGAIMGTPYYMSPEQARGSLQADARSDLYSVGVIMYEALTGNVPFDGQTINELMFAIALNDPKPLREVLPDIDPTFATIVDKAMTKDKEARYQNAAEFSAAIAAWQGAKAVSPSAAPAASPSGAPAASPSGAPAASPSGAPAAQAIPQGTSSTWSKSQADATMPGRNSTPIIAATVIGSLVMLSAVGFGAYKLLGSDDSDASAAAAGEVQDEPTPSAAPAPEPSEPEPEVTPEPTATVAEPTPSVAPEPTAAPTPQAAPAAPPEPKVAPKPTPKPRVAPKPRPRPAPSPAPKKNDVSRFGY